MLTRIVLFLLVVGLVYLNYTTPSVEDHKAFLLSRLEQGGYPVSDEMQKRIWKDVDYSNFMVCSFMKTSEDSKMISSGYLKKVKLVNDKWVEEVKADIQKQSSIY
jgi:hypothetical protein